MKNVALVYGAGGTVVYPQILGLASTWMLWERMTSEIRCQLRSVGAHEGLAPVLDAARDPRWWRVMIWCNYIFVMNIGVSHAR